MPVTRPEDKGKDRSQWWKNASTEQVEDEEADKLHHGVFNEQEKPENLRKEEMAPLENPS